MNKFFTSVKTPFYIEIIKWVDENINEEFFIFPSSQSNEKIYDFCSAVLDKNKTPVLITPLSGWDKKYPSVLQNRAKQFVKINGGIIWTR